MAEILRVEAEEVAATEAGFTFPEVDPEPVPEDQISTALFDLNSEDIKALQAMEDEIY